MKNKTKTNFTMPSILPYERPAVNLVRGMAGQVAKSQETAHFVWIGKAKSIGQATGYPKAQVVSRLHQDNYPKRDH